MRKVIAVAFLMVVVIGFATRVSQGAVSRDDERGYIVEIGQMAPGFEMTLTTGEKVKLSSLRGKVVMLQFTASWCGVCRKEMPFIETEIWQKHRNNSSFALYGIDKDEPVEKVNTFIHDTGISYPVALDIKGKIFSLFALKDAGITRNVIIDKTGKIRYLTRLFEREEFDEMKAVIEELLKE
jgi:peroxiredoxin